MHFVIGGAFHGKKRWVSEKIFGEDSASSFQWFNSYQYNEFLELPVIDHSDSVVIEGVEQLIKHLLAKKDCQLVFQAWIDSLIDWEKDDPSRQLFVIGTDITKGIVPIDTQERLWRDEVGRCFQYLSLKATKVSLIWYGLEQELKK